MSFALTYGSFGDIITTVQLIGRLAQAISESRGSARELQELVVELRLYQNVLQQLIFFWESRKQDPKLNELANIVRPVIFDCKEAIEAFLEKAVKKYGRTLLRQVGSKKGFWDIVKMIQWHVCEKEDVEKLRDRLSRSKATIQLVQIQAQEITRAEDHSVISDRIAALMDTERKADAMIEAQFAKVMDSLKDENRTISRIESVSNALLSTVTSISNNILVIRSTALSVERMVFGLSETISRLSLFRYNTVYVEDALGWTLPIILDAHPSWETVHSMISDQFARHRSPGLKLVKGKRYRIHNNRTGKDANFKVSFYEIARPGETFAMSMVFHADLVTGDDNLEHKQQSECPSCGYVNMVEDPDNDVTCQNSRCQLIYRRVIDVTNVAEEHLREWVNDSHPLETYHDKNGKYNDDDSNDEHEDDKSEGDYEHDGDKENNTMDIENIGRKMLNLSKETADGPEIFKRVRFLSRWEDRIESRGKVYATVGNVHLWDVSTHGTAEAADFQMHVSFWAHVQSCIDWIKGDSRSRLGSSASSDIWMFTGFMGHDKEKAKPVVVLISNSNQVKKRFLTVVKRLSWIRENSQISLITAPPSVFGDNDTFERWRWEGRQPESFHYKRKVEVNRLLRYR